MRTINYILLIFFVPLYLTVQAAQYDSYIVEFNNNVIQHSSFSTQVVKDDSQWTELTDFRETNILSVQTNRRLAVWHNHESLSEDDVMNLMSQRSDIVSIEPVYPVELHSKYNDVFYSKQTYLQDAGLQFLNQIPGLNDVIVAVIDTGVDMFHSDLDEQMYINHKEIINGRDDDGNGYVDDRYGVDFYGKSKTGYPSGKIPLDEFGHGTHLAGIIAARSNNQLGIVGLNPNVKVMNLKFLNQAGKGNQIDAAYAIRYAVDNGAKIINCSWGFYRYNTILKDAIQYARDHHVIVVGAVGNSNVNVPEYPAAFPGVIAVGSVAANNFRSGFSSYGHHLDFVMPGEEVFSLMPNDDYAIQSGTSQSAAMFSGVVARLLSYNDRFSANEIESILHQSVDDLDVPGKDNYTGYGRINIPKLLSTLTIPFIEDMGGQVAAFNTQTNEISNVLNYPNPIPVNQGTHFSFQDPTGGQQYRIQVFDANGSVVNEITGISQQGKNDVYWTAQRTDGQFLGRGSYFWVLSLMDNGKIYKNILVIK